MSLISVRFADYCDPSLFPGRSPQKGNRSPRLQGTTELSCGNRSAIAPFPSFVLQSYIKNYKNNALLPVTNIYRYLWSVSNKKLLSEGTGNCAGKGAGARCADALELLARLCSRKCQVDFFGNPFAAREGFASTC